MTLPEELTPQAAAARFQAAVAGGALSIEDQLRDELRRVRHDLEHVKAERDAAAARLKGVLELWTEQIKTVRIEPGNVLAIGCVDYNHGIDIGEALGNFREAIGASAVWLFTGDIDVRAIQLNRTDETKPFFSDVDVAVECGAIKLYGDGDQLIADLPGERAEILRDMLGDAIKARDKQREMLAVKGREAS